MPEILTESFCERCGTRYTFESAAPTKVRKLGKFKTISKGLKNYVMSDDTSLDEAMAAARSDEELEQTAQQLDAFHSTFNFCMNCRQYTCANCWNEAESRCLTCAPPLGQEVLPAPFPRLPAQPEPTPEVWPEADIKPAAAAAFAEAVAEAETESAEVVADAKAETAEVVDIDAADRLDRLSPTQDDAVPRWLADAEAEALASAEARAALEAAEEAYVTAELPFEEDAPVESTVVAAEVATPVELEPEPEIVAAEVTPAEHVAAEETPAPIAPDLAVATIPEPVDAGPAEVDVAAVAEPAEADAAAVAAVGLAAAAAIERPEELTATPEVVPAAAEVEPVAPVEVEGQAAAAAQQTSVLFAKFRPGQNIDAELAAYEAAVAAEAVDVVADDAQPPAAEQEPEPALPVEAEPQPVEAVEPVVAEPIAAAEPEPEPDLAAAAALAAVAAAQAAPEPEAVAAELEAAPAQEPEAAPEPRPEPEPVAAEAAPEPVRTDVVPQPTWRIVAPDAPSNGHAPEGLPVAASAVPPAPSAPEAPPQWPTTPEWPQPTVSHLAQRPASQSAAMEALWAASVRDVVAPTQGGPAGTVQPCNSCGLSLSANARFCRRCGTRQGG